MAMTIDCGKLVSMSGCVTPPPPTMNSKLDMVGGHQEEEVATPKLGAGAGQMDGVMADALNSKLQQLQEQMFLKLEEARIVPGHLSGEKMNLGSDFVKVPLPAQETPAVEPMLLPPPTPHSVQRPAKDPRFRPIPDRANVVISKGSVGHPFACAAACKYVKRKGGCRDGANCLLCHECFWSKTSSKDSEKRNDDQAKVEEAARARPVLVSTEEDLTLEFTRLLSTSTEACSLLTPLRQDSYPASDILGFSMGCPPGLQGFAPPGLEMPLAMNPGSLGHPYSCGPACKYVLKSRGCKDGDNCTHCHLCHWTRYSAKTLKL